jgi:exonuclease VII large subunit
MRDNRKLASLYMSALHSRNSIEHEKRSLVDTLITT